MRTVFNFLFGWVNTIYHYFCKHNARKTVYARQKFLKDNIRVVISFNEDKGTTSAVIKVGQYTALELFDNGDEGALASAPQILKHLRTINRHVVF